MSPRVDISTSGLTPKGIDSTTRSSAGASVDESWALFGAVLAIYSFAMMVYRFGELLAEKME